MDLQWKRVVMMAALLLVFACAVGLVYLRILHEDDSMPAEATPTPITAFIAPISETAPTGTAKPEPETKDYILSFAGDCTLGTLLEWQTGVDNAFPSVVGDNFTYPLSNVKSIFENDDFTMVNLECALTDSSSGVYKKYRLKGEPAYARVLSAGAVEAVSLSNNHTRDFGTEGLADTRAALATEGILFGETGSPLIVQLEGGLTLGIISYNTVENYQTDPARLALIAADIKACKSAGCDFILSFMHWGWEYYAEPVDWQVQLAHEMIDRGCDMVIGCHPHILQPAEYYEGAPIFYSLGNFCFGGNLNPDDKDTAIVQVTVKYDAKRGTAELGKLDIIPCAVSSVSSKNDYRPTPYEKGSPEFERVFNTLAKLAVTG